METEGSLPHSHQSPTLSTLSHINQVQNLPKGSLKTHFNIIPACTPRSYKWPLSLSIPNKTPALISPLLHTCYMLRPSHSYYLTTLMIFGEAYNEFFHWPSVLLLLLLLLLFVIVPFYCASEKNLLLKERFSLCLRDSAVCLLSRIRAGRQTRWKGMSAPFPAPQNVGPPILLFKGYWGTFPGSKEAL